MHLPWHRDPRCDSVPRAKKSHCLSVVKVAVLGAANGIAFRACVVPNKLDQAVFANLGHQG